MEIDSSNRFGVVLLEASFTAPMEMAEKGNKGEDGREGGCSAKNLLLTFLEESKKVFSLKVSFFFFSFYGCLSLMGVISFTLKPSKERKRSTAH